MMGEPTPTVVSVQTLSLYATNPSALESFDSFEFLQDFVSSLEDVSQEILYSLAELREKDIEYHGIHYKKKKKSCNSLRN